MTHQIPQSRSTESLFLFRVTRSRNIRDDGRLEGIREGMRPAAAHCCTDALFWNRPGVPGDGDSAPRFRWPPSYSESSSILPRISGGGFTNGLR